MTVKKMTYRASLAALFLGLSSGVLAQTEGEQRDIDGQKLSYKGGVWAHGAVAGTEAITDENTATYRDKKWARWYNQGSPTLKKMMDLGRSVIFKFKGPDGRMKVFAIFGNKSQARKAIGAGTVDGALQAVSDTGGGLSSGGGSFGGSGFGSSGTLGGPVDLGALSQEIANNVSGAASAQ